MADLEDKRNFSEHYPAPPPFWRKFTEVNIKRVKEIKESGNPIPQELRALVPPPVPVDGKFRSFGGNYNLHEALPELEAIGVERLYPKSSDEADVEEDAKIQSKWTFDRAFHLQKIVRSILLNFLELIGILSQDATQSTTKISDLETLFANAFHILNEFRPHQARETLILLMEEQVERRRNEIDAMKKLKEKVEAMSTLLPNPEAAHTNGHNNVIMTNGHDTKLRTLQPWAELDD